MNLIYSMITSVFIMAGVWLIALLQPNAAEAKPALSSLTDIDDVDLFVKDAFMAANLAQSDVDGEQEVQATKLSEGGSKFASHPREQEKGESGISSLIDESSSSMSPRSGMHSNVDAHKLKIVGDTRDLPLTQLDTLWQTFNNNQALNGLLRRAPSKVYVYYRTFSASYGAALVTIGYDQTELMQQTPAITLKKHQFEPILEKGRYNNKTLASAWQQFDYSKGPQSVLEVHYLLPDGSTDSSELYVSYQ